MRWIFRVMAPLLALSSVGCGADVEQTAACSDYVVCIQAQDEARGVTTDLARFEADGDCWGSEEGAELCDRACQKGVSWIRERFDALPEECAP